MTWTLWLRIFIRLAGAAALAALIWFAAPFLRWRDAYPFEAQAPRLAAILAVLLLVAASGAYWLYQRRQNARRIARGISGPDSGAPVGAGPMKEALAALASRRAGLAHYLCDLPWYLVIGPPGSGKTAALAQSNLSFPLASGAAPKPIAGAGALHEFGWRFAEEATLIETSVPSAGTGTSSKDRLAFLNLLKRNRPGQPINGVLLVLSLEDLLTLSTPEAEARAAAIRSRLVELRQRLGAAFPVYALFTKADLVAGFSEYFKTLSESARAQVWGATFQRLDKTKSALGELETEFNALVERLSAGAARRLAEEKDPQSRALLFGFPAQMQALHVPLATFLNQIFDAKEGRLDLVLRGFYFVSAKQDGAPINRLLAGLARAVGGEPAKSPVQAGESKSFFLRDLLAKVVIGEAGLASTGRSARIALACLLAVASLAIGALLMGYFKNVGRIAQIESAASKYSALAASLGGSDAVADRDLAKALPALHALRYLPGGFAAERSGADRASGGFGLNQSPRLRAAAAAAYGAGLEQLFRPRLIYRLEEQIEANPNNPTALFDALEAYLMLGGLETVNRQRLIDWLQRDWADNLYSGPKNADGRKELEQHLAAMLDLANGRQSQIALNGPLVAKARAALARVNVAERAYQRLAARAKASGHEDWIAAKAIGPEASAIFETSIDSARIPYFFTKPGFEQAFLEELPAVEKEMARERRILGEAGEAPEASSQYARVSHDLIGLYVKAFTASWRDALAKIKLRRLTAKRPSYPLLAAAIASPSPLVRLAESIRDETLLPEAGQKAAAEEAAEPAPESASSPDAASETPARMINAALKPYHQLVEGEPENRPIDLVVSGLKDIAADLHPLAAGGPPSDQLVAKAASSVAALKTLAATLPQPFDDMMNATAEDAGAEVGDLATARTMEALRSAISGACQDKIASRYPFARDGKKEVALEDFARMFAPKGLIDQFAAEHILPVADASGPEWKWREGEPLAKKLGAAGLASFQRAAEIRDAFFTASDPSAPGFKFTATPPALPGASLDIDGAIIAGKTRGPAPALRWPGPATERRAVLSFRAGRRGSGTIERSGVWAIFRLIDAGHSNDSGTAATFSLAGRELEYRFDSIPATAGGVLKPLDLAGLRKFRCPVEGEPAARRTR